MKKTAIRIDTPCHADWASMSPKDRGRFCGECKKVVHEIAKMTECEAKALLSGARNGDLCVRYVYDAYGNMLFADSRTELVAPSLLNRAKRAALVAAAAALPMTLGCSSGSTGASSELTITSSSSSSSSSSSGSSSGFEQGAVSEYIPDDAGADAEQSDAKPTKDAGPDAEPSDASVDSYVPPT